MGKHKNLPNPEFNKAMQELGRSSATSPHEDKRTKRAKTNKQALRKHLRENPDG